VWAAGGGLLLVVEVRMCVRERVVVRVGLTVWWWVRPLLTGVM
jgi:hypothetical protein